MRRFSPRKIKMTLVRYKVRIAEISRKKYYGVLIARETNQRVYVKVGGSYQADVHPFCLNHDSSD